MPEVIHLGERQLLPGAAAQGSAEDQSAVSYSDKAAHPQADSLENPSYLAVPSLMENDVVPPVDALASDKGDFVKGCHAVRELDALSELLEDLIAYLAEDSYGILPLDYMRGMHQAVRELTVIGEEDETRGIDVKPSDRHPAAVRDNGKRLEHRRPALRVAP